MLETVGSVIATPWIYGIIAASVVLDVFLPFLPSGVLIIAAATAVAGTTAADAANLSAHARHAAESAGSQHFVGMLWLVLCATAASVVGDVVAYRLARRGSDRFGRAVSRSRKLSLAQERLGQALVRGGGALVVLARFAPAGRSVVSLMAGAAQRRPKEFVPWSALAGLTWAAYSVSLGYFGSRWLGASWLGTAVSVLALVAAGSVAACMLRRTPRTAADPQDALRDGPDGDARSGGDARVGGDARSGGAVVAEPGEPLNPLPAT